MEHRDGTQPNFSVPLFDTNHELNRVVYNVLNDKYDDQFYVDFLYIEFVYQLNITADDSPQQTYHSAFSVPHRN